MDKGALVDSPGQRLVSGSPVEWVIIDESYKSGLMYNSGESEAIWVPLKAVSWGWKANAQQVSNVWKGDPDSYKKTNIDIDDAPDFPHWEGGLMQNIQVGPDN